MDYTYRITNTGDVMLIGLRAIDSRLGPIAPGHGGAAAGRRHMPKRTSLPSGRDAATRPAVAHGRGHRHAASGANRVAGAAEVQIASQPALVVTQQATNSANVGERPPLPCRYATPAM